MPVILNQYRRNSGYKDAIGERYHFPNRYKRSLGQPPVKFVYYEPRDGGDQVYFGTGVIRSIVDDTEDEDHSYADIDEYRTFKTALDFFVGPTGTSWELPATMRNSVRQISDDLFSSLLHASGLPVTPIGSADDAHYAHRLEREIECLRGRHDPPVLRKKRRILESYERPHWVTNQVKRERGDKCQICGIRGFAKRGGGRYCEIHHLFHLCDDPSEKCFGPEYVAVVCATCHRRLHFANVTAPMRVQEGWELTIDGDRVLIPMAFASPS